MYSSNMDINYNLIISIICLSIGLLRVAIMLSGFIFTDYIRKSNFYIRFIKYDLLRQTNSK